MKHRDWPQMQAGKKSHRIGSGHASCLPTRSTILRNRCPTMNLPAALFTPSWPAELELAYARHRELRALGRDEVDSVLEEFGQVGGASRRPGVAGSFRTITSRSTAR